MADEERMDPARAGRIARRCSQQPEFLGYWLDLFREGEGLSVAALARHLGCPLESLDDLAMCLKPAGDQLAAGTLRLATRFGVDRKRLLSVILQAETWEGHRAAAPPAQTAPARHGLPVFAAAQDREDAPAENGSPAAPSESAEESRDGD